MATEVIMPALGMAQETGRLVAWLRSEGAQVVRGDPLMEVETDKTRVEIEAPASGIVAGVRVGEGAEVPVGTVLAWVLAPGEVAPAPGPVAAPAAASPAVRAAASPVVPAAASPAAPAAASPVVRAAASPVARRLAAERGIGLAAVRGSGPGGAIVAADVRATVAQGSGPDVGPLRRRMAEHTARVWSTTPHFFLGRDVRAGRLTDWMAVLRRRAGPSVTVTDLLLRVMATALRQHPVMRDHVVDGAVRRHEGNHLGLAVATQRGLMVVVVRDADRLSTVRLSELRREVVARARAAALRSGELEGAALTLSNLGPQGVDRFGAVLPERQSAILAAGRVRDQVVAVGGRPRVEPVLSLTLSCDHRVLDGVQASAFFATVVELLEEPALLLDAGPDG